MARKSAKMRRESCKWRQLGWLMAKAKKMKESLNGRNNLRK
jgi:hypothetical protein